MHVKFGQAGFGSSLVTALTGIIPFSCLGVFYDNLGSAEIFFATRKGGPQNKW